MPKISILVPIYNVEAYLQRCINSVLVQDFQDWEMILVNDGSPDNCSQICDDNATTDKRIRVIHKKNGGLISARLAGFKEAKGAYLMFLDSDDLLTNGALGKLYQTALAGDYDMVRGEGVRLTPANHTFPLEKYKIGYSDVLGHIAFLKNIYLGHAAPYLWGALYKRSLFSEKTFTVSMEQGITLGEDWVTNMIVGSMIEKAKYIDTVVYQYFVNEVSIMGTSITSNEYEDRVDAALSISGIYNFKEIEELHAVKLACNYIRNAFKPELKFSDKAYCYIINTMQNELNKKRIEQTIESKFLRFINYKQLYHLYTYFYRFFFLYTKLNGQKRHILS